MDSSNNGLNGQDKLTSKYDPTEPLVPLEVTSEGDGSICEDVCDHHHKLTKTMKTSERL